MNEMIVNANCADIVTFAEDYKRTVRVFQTFYNGDMLFIGQTLRHLVWDISRAEDPFSDEKQYKLRYTQKSQHALKTWFQYSWSSRKPNNDVNFMEIYKTALTDNPFLDVLIYSVVVQTRNSLASLSLPDKLGYTAAQAATKLEEITAEEMRAVFVDPHGNRVQMDSLVESVMEAIRVIGDKCEFHVNDRHDRYEILAMPFEADEVEIKIAITKPVSWDRMAKWN